MEFKLLSSDNIKIKNIIIWKMERFGVPFFWKEYYKNNLAN